MSLNRTTSEPKLPSTICLLPWMHSFSDPMGRVKPCCRFESNESEMLYWKSTAEYFESDFAKSLRQDFLAGKKPSGCRRCWEEEGSGKKSLRQRHQSDIEFQKDFDSEYPKIRYLEVSMSNVCNLACRMCDSRYSSLWFAQEEVLYGKTRAPVKLKKINPLEDLGDLKDIKILKVTGGEPLLAKEFLVLLEFLVTSNFASQIALIFVTNCTIPPRQELVELLAKFKRVDITFSLDSDKASEWEYIRWPSKFTHIEENIFAWMKAAQAHWRLSCRPTVSILNPVGAVGALLLFKQCALKSKLKTAYTLNITHVTHPPFLSLTVLPMELKNLVAQLVMDRAKQTNDDEILHQAHYIINYMNSSDDSSTLKKTKQELLAVDSLRKQSYQESCDHLRDLFNSADRLSSK